ncbi:MAG: DUF1592 domain-containing protein [Polyangiaceae bacterium]|nr:DUF1592 domain-containing protein [Polyangiaceae bacterium]
MALLLFAAPSRVRGARRPARLRSVILGASFVFCLLGCSTSVPDNGQVGSSAASPTGGASGGARLTPEPSGIGGAASGVGGGGVGSAAGGMQGTVPPQPWPYTCSLEQLDPGPSFIRKLTNREYDNSVRDLLGENFQRGWRIVRDVHFEALPTPSSDFPQDSTIGGFDNNAEVVDISVEHASQYLNQAERIAGAVVADPKRRDKVIGCSLEGTARAACLQDFVSRFGRLAYRRPLTVEENSAFLALAQSPGPSPYSGAQLVIEAVLQSPKFLFRHESGTKDPRRPELLRLGGYELASRLAYFLWGTAPDSGLLDRAAAGELEGPVALANTVDLMLNDARAEEGLRSLVQQWLKTDRILQSAPGGPFKNEYGGRWTFELQPKSEEETLRFVSDLIWRDKANFLDLVTASYSIIDWQLASYVYKIPEPSTAALGWVRAELPAGQRSGILTQPSFLVSTGQHQAPAIERGKYIREVLLCETLPQPPPTIPALPEKIRDEGERERLARHRTDPACSACHALLEPLGFGLARYDGIGVYTEDPNVSDAGTLAGFPSPDFVGAPALGQKLRSSPALQQCVVSKVLTYALARTLGSGDVCTRDYLSQAFLASEGSFLELVRALARSEAFTYVRDEQIATR